MNRDYKTAGFTLIESIIVVAIIGILTAVVSSFYVQSMASYRSGSTAQLVQSDLRYAMNYMVRELQGARAVSWSAGNPSRLEYTDVNGNSRFFNQNGSTIQRYDSQPLCQYVNNLTFNLVGTRVDISITSVSSLPGRPNEGGLPFVLQTSVVPRNAHAAVSISSPFVNFLLNDQVFVYGSELVFEGSSVTGNNSTIVIRSHNDAAVGLHSNSINDGAVIAVSNIHVDGSVTILEGSNHLGSFAYPGLVNITGNTDLTGNNARIFGEEVYISGNLVSTLGSSSIGGEQVFEGPIQRPELVYVGGTLNFAGGNSKVYGDVIYVAGAGTSYMGSGNLGQASPAGSVYLNGPLQLSGSGNIYGMTRVEGAVTMSGGHIHGGPIYIGSNTAITGGGSTLNGDIHIGGDFSIANSGAINGGRVYIAGNVNLPQGSLNATDAYVGGNVIVRLSGSLSANRTFVGGNLTVQNYITVASDVYVNGNLDMQYATLTGNAFVRGDVTINTWNSTLGVGNVVRYSGTLHGTPRPEYVSRFVHDPSIAFPAYPPAGTSLPVPIAPVPTTPVQPPVPSHPLPGLHHDSWYLDPDRGYSANPPVLNGMRVFSDDYSANFSEKTVTNAIIVSKKDIDITGSHIDFTGVLYAPFGKVSFGQGNFTGLVLARDGFSVQLGSGTVVFKDLHELIPNSSNYPFPLD